jgi:hypothetical protein
LEKRRRPTKKVVLIVPDKVDRTTTTKTGKYHSSIEVTPDNILKVLGKRDDYHEDFCFEDLNKITVLSIDDYEES